MDFQLSYCFRQAEVPGKVKSVAKKKKRTSKAESESEDAGCDEGDASDGEGNDASYKPKKKPTKASKAQTGNKKDKKGLVLKKDNPPGADEDPEADEPRWMAKYRMKDLKAGKGDLEGLFPYLVAQIVDVDTEKVKGSRGVTRMVALSLHHI